MKRKDLPFFPEKRKTPYSGQMKLQWIRILKTPLNSCTGTAQGI